ncbi:uncharacterized protein LOC116400157 [Anarrhichthys ocellatus]|uniref:uncharacterized protein LOC116400157 n=1 Tax=Anarrhichthys ocellatus TaxID=433405 RepID=UPI0012ECFA5A|nr:uncharacterized protein LOC116400157 [Anarrhichthys ocellatus]XP_031733709.1 uncharacterized protein LOC116400157 [Anarrhichthys ocellatus]XP_031733710.1 uncharacterized protein LOC116400157 [Anarrhichthys ocellatus]XP_031733711.1 uncharacterized protein LOC116400157 [Anarrhichthys ocellatus]
MGKPLSRPGCFRKSSCCLEKPGDGGVGGRAGGLEGGYGDGYVPQRSIYDTMCINQQIDSHHHHPGGSIRRDIGGEGSFSYSASGSLRVSRSPADMFDPQPRSLTPNPSFVRRLDERAIYDSLKLGAQDVDGGGCHSPGCFNRSVSPSVSSFSAPGVSSSSSKKHHHHQHHGDSTKSRDGRHSWKVLTPPKHLGCLELTTNEMMDRGGGYLNPGQYPPPGGQSSSLTSPLISPFSGSPLSSGYHTPVFFSPAKPRPSQSQSLRCSPPHVTQPRHYSQTQSLRLSPPQELRRSPYRAPLVQLSAHDLEQDMRERGGGWGRSEREREWEREREREMERGWAQREWERERERGRLERERARERERRETSTFGTFGYGRPVPLRSDRDSVFLESEQVLDTTPLLLPQPSPSPNAAPRMGTGAVGRNRAGSKVGPESVGGGMVSKFDNGSVGLVLVDSRSGCGPRLISEVGIRNMSEAEIRAGIQEHHRVESWNKYDNGSRASIRNGSETRMGSQVKTQPGGRDLEGKVQSGMGIENIAPALNKEGHRGGTRSGEKNVRGVAKPEHFAETIPSTVNDNENRIEPGDKVEIGDEPGPAMKPEAGVEAKVSSRQVENRTGTEVGGEATVKNEVGSGAESRVEAQVETEVKIAPTSEPEEVLEAVSNETETKSNTETGVVSETQNSNNFTTDKAQISIVAGGKTDIVSADQVEKKPSDIDKIKSSHVEKGSRSHKSKLSKSSSRTRPGTATGLRPGVVSPRLSRGFADLESTGPADGIESTWPRRIMVRKRTVRQGGALHNLPILPPLPSVLSALEKRRPHAHLHPRPGHFSENPLTTIMNASSMVGQCSLKEPSHPELGIGASVVGRASLKEQNLEHWRVCSEQDEPRRSRSKEKQVEQSKENTEMEERTGKEEKRDKARKKDKVKMEEKVDKEKDRVTVSEGLVEETKREKSERKIEGKVQEDGNTKDLKKARNVEIMGGDVEVRGVKTNDGIQERHVQELEKVVAKSKKEESQMEEQEGGTFGEEGGVEAWDTVLDMVNTLWEDGWEKGGEGGGGDTDSFSGSLQRWPLLRPPIGFGGSHPPSSAASELSLTELERRARELDSDLEHLDLSQPHRDTHDIYQSLLEPQRERADMYQTHPGPQREKAALSTGVVSRSEVSLELSAIASPATDTDRPPVDWSTKSAGTTTVGTSSTKEDSSPDSNLTLESDSSGVFLSLSNQSQEEAGSDSDQPISGSDLGSSSTSLEKDGEDGGLKEWGREESAELQWCYPSLLNTSAYEDVGGDGGRQEAGRGQTGRDGDGGKGESGRRVGKIGTVSIIRTQLDQTNIEGSTSLNAPQSEETPPRKKVTLMGSDFPLPLSPSKQPYQKPIRSSGLDCGDLDPFVQSDSFVYLAVSARPASQGGVAALAEVPTHGIKHDIAQQQSESMKTHLDQSNTERNAKPTYLAPQKPEEGDFLCTDSFVYLAAPACLLLGPAGNTPYSGRESDSESSGSGPVDLSVLGCDSVAGDSDWDSDLSDSDPSRSSRLSAAGNKSASVARSKRPPAEPDWDLFGETNEAEVLSELFTEQDKNNNGKARKVTGATAGLADTAAIPEATQNVPTPVKRERSAEQSSTAKKVTWQFRPAQRSVCTGSRKEKEKEVTSSPLVGFTELRGGETHRPCPSSSSSSSSSSG